MAQPSDTDPRQEIPQRCLICGERVTANHFARVMHDGRTAACIIKGKAGVT